MNRSDNSDWSHNLERKTRRVSAFFFSFLKPGIFFQDQDYYY